MIDKPTLYLVIPCYNEEEMLPISSRKIEAKLNEMIKTGTIGHRSKILLVNDGSKDNTQTIIEQLHAENTVFEGVKLSKNFGHQNAVLAGLMTAKDRADCMVSMDADLQDDINVLDKMIEEYKNGAHIVYGVRSSRKTDTVFKRGTAEMFYKLMKTMGVDLVFNHADYRLMSSRAVNELSGFTEANLFLRGIVRLIGFKEAFVYYERKEREAGETKYPLKKELSFAIDGITSFSVKPLRLIAVGGFIIFLISLIAIFWVFIRHFVDPTIDIGWPSVICSIWIIGGIQILCIGILGEYIGKIYSETKHRPRYIIEWDSEKE